VCLGVFCVGLVFFGRKFHQCSITSQSKKKEGVVVSRVRAGEPKTRVGLGLPFAGSHKKDNPSGTSRDERICQDRLDCTSDCERVFLEGIDSEGEMQFWIK